jgi:hypothetical protein
LVAGGYVFGRVIQKHTVNLTYPVLDDEQRVKAVVFASLDLTGWTASWPTSSCRPARCC